MTLIHRSSSWISQCHLKPLTRSISIAQTAVVQPASALETPHQDQHLELQSHSLPINPDAEFQVLGTPPSLLALKVSPSIPVYIRKGSLISLQSTEPDSTASDLSTINRQYHLLSFWKSLIFGGFASSYEKLVSTVEYNALVSSQINKSGFRSAAASQKSVVSVVLDGRVDWAVLSKSSLQAYMGPSLSVSLEKLPKTISRTLANLIKASKSSLTGLFQWTRAGFVFISGRGQVALTGSGQIYRVILKENESFLVNRDNLLAVSVNGESDLANCVVSHDLANGSVNPPPSVVDSSKASKTLANLSTKFKSLFSSSLFSNSHYVKVFGPRNLLVQTNSNVQLSHALKNTIFNDINVNDSELKIKSADQLNVPELSSSSFLKIASVYKDGRVEFRSTDNFQDAVKKIERK